MKKGGYQILNFKDIEIPNDGSTIEIQGVYKLLKETKKPIMLSGLVYDDIEYKDTFVTIIDDGDSFTFEAYDLTFTIYDDDNVGVETPSSFTQVYLTKTSDNNSKLSNMDTSKIYTLYSSSLYYLYYFTYNGSWSGVDEDGDNSNIEITTQSTNTITFHMKQSSDAYYFGDWLDYIMLEGSEQATNSDFEGLTTNNTLSQYVCFVEGTLITLANGKQKKVENLTYKDKVLCWDFDNGKMSTGDIFWIAKENKASYYWRVTLSDGTILKLVGAKGKCHRLFSIDKQKFMYPQDFSGKIYKENGEEPLIVKCERVKENVKYYNFMNTHLNAFANGVMTGNRFSNIYDIKNMVYVKDNVTRNNINSYEYQGIPKLYIKNLRLKEQQYNDGYRFGVKYFTTLKDHIYNLYELNKKEV